MLLKVNYIGLLLFLNVYPIKQDAESRKTLAFIALNTNGQAAFVTFELATNVTQRLELVL